MENEENRCSWNYCGKGFKPNGVAIFDRVYTNSPGASTASHGPAPSRKPENSVT